MPEYAEEQTKPTNGNQQPEQHPSQPLEVQPDGTWILGRGADRWMPTKYQIGDMRWLVERDLRNELGVPPKYARDAEKIEFTSGNWRCWTWPNRPRDASTFLPMAAAAKHPE
jgi:hypothetical protein